MSMHKKNTLDTAPIVVSARTLVPVRAVAEGLGVRCRLDRAYKHGRYRAERVQMVGVDGRAAE